MKYLYLLDVAPRIFAARSWGEASAEVYAEVCEFNVAALRAWEPCAEDISHLETALGREPLSVELRYFRIAARRRADELADRIEKEVVQ